MADNTINLALVDTQGGDIDLLDTSKLDVNISLFRTPKGPKLKLI